jgi:hypothetical protein
VLQFYSRSEQKDTTNGIRSSSTKVGLRRLSTTGEKNVFTSLLRFLLSLCIKVGLGGKKPKIKVYCLGFSEEKRKIKVYSIGF